MRVKRGYHIGNHNIGNYHYNILRDQLHVWASCPAKRVELRHGSDFNLKNVNKYKS